MVSNVDARTYGFELNATYDVTDHVSISGGPAFTNAEIRSVPGALAALRPNLERGDRLPNVPRWTVSTALDVSTPINGLIRGLIPEGLFTDAALSGRIGYDFIGERFPDPENTIALDPVHLLSARVGLQVGPVEAFVFGDNLLDEEYEVTNQFFGPNAATGEPVFAASYARGATVGGGLRVTW